MDMWITAFNHVDYLITKITVQTILLCTLIKLMQQINTDKSMRKSIYWTRILYPR